jgi:2-polyprenyl-3-methyl-5-hydroxy-6-metoxy-1,4-benzoquinol methylase
MVSLEVAQNEMRRRGLIAQALIASKRPELLDLYLTYQNEAVAARRFLDRNLNELKDKAKILEVGGGILSLAVQLASEGFTVTTVEPVGGGFGGIPFMMEIFTEIARNEGLEFDLLATPIEDCKFDNSFDFIFSINVMEHLENPYSVLMQLIEVLNKEGRYRFFCPNYDFPYEPHFGKWLYFRKNNAFYLQKNRARTLMVTNQETLGLYQSLNFLTLRKLKKCSSKSQIRIKSNRDAFYNILERVIYDQNLSKRHGRLAFFVRVLHTLKLHYFAKLIPTNYQPIMDIEASKMSI